jgi:hypothetical protein
VSDGLVWFALGVAVGIVGTILVFGIRMTRRLGPSAATPAHTTVRSTGRSLRILVDAIEIGGVRYRRLAEVPAADRGLVADELRVSRDLLPPDAAELAMIDAFLSDDGERTA